MRWHTRLLAAGAATAAISVVATGASAAEPLLVPAVDRGVTFVVDGTTTYGTVHVPAHRAGARLAAALLIPGSGTTDRNGDSPPSYLPDTLRLLADAFGEDGVMTLRFDKYFTGETGPGRYQDDPSRIDISAFTRQAAAAYDTMRAQPEADPHALLIAGHSEGALQALLLDRVVTPRPAGLALIAPQDLRLLDAINYQTADELDQLVAAGALGPAVAATNKAGVARAIADFRAGHPVDTSGLLPFIVKLLNGALVGGDARYTRSDDAIYPPDVARHVARGTRILVTCGTRDTQVPCWTTPPVLGALADAGVAGPGLVVLPDVDHELHPPGVGTNEQVLAPAALAAVHQFAAPWHSGSARP
jgi:uncharacterized protein